jgi:hypothetical protein
MTDASPDAVRPNGREPESRPRFSTAEDVSPPLPGDPGYEDYVERRAEWMHWIDQQRADTPGADLVATPYYDAGLGRMVTPEDPAPEAEPAVDAASSGGGVDAPVSRDDIARGQPRPWQRTDAANGELFAQLYGHRVRYDHRRGHWLLWGDDWWRPDEVGVVRILAKEAARLRYEEAADIEDLRQRTQEAGFAIQSENRYRLEAMLAQARSESPIADAGDSWDADPWLFGVSNGIVDLRTGRLRPGDPADRVTLHTGVVFDPESTCPRWEQFLVEVGGPRRHRRLARPRRGTPGDGHPDGEPRRVRVRRAHRGTLPRTHRRRTRALDRRYIVGKAADANSVMVTPQRRREPTRRVPAA